MNARTLIAATLPRRMSLFDTLVSIVTATAFMIVAGGPVRAQGSGENISVTFGANDVWNAAQADIDQLHTCSQPTITCVSQVMQESRASQDAIAFYRLTGWILSDLKSGSPVELGTVFNPWRANENYQPVLLGGSPAVVLPEVQVAGIDTASWSSDPTYASLSSTYPNLTFWGSGPSLETVSTAPGGGQRFIFDYRMLDGCHACATVAIARIAFDFAPDGTYLAATQLNLAPPPASAAGAPPSATASE